MLPNPILSAKCYRGRQSYRGRRIISWPPNPIVTAKSVASVDRLSNGRFIFGIGGGWNAEEMENHGTEFENRFRILVDRAKAMQKIWTQQEAHYDGEFVQLIQSGRGLNLCKSHTHLYCSAERQSTRCAEWSILPMGGFLVGTSCLIQTPEWINFDIMRTNQAAI